MIGGIFTSFLLELLVYPGIYKSGSGTSEMKGDRETAPKITSQPVVAFASGPG